MHVKKRIYVFDYGYTTPNNGIPFGDGGRTKKEIQNVMTI